MKELDFIWTLPCTPMQGFFFDSWCFSNQQSNSVNEDPSIICFHIILFQAFFIDQCKAFDADDHALLFQKPHNIWFVGVLHIVIGKKFRLQTDSNALFPVPKTIISSQSHLIANHILNLLRKLNELEQIGTNFTFNHTAEKPLLSKIFRLYHAAASPATVILLMF